MTAILEFREKLRNLYAHYSIYMITVFKFVLALVTFLGINHTMGYLKVLNNPFVVIVCALICSIMPINGIVTMAGIFVIGHCYAIGIEIAAFALLLLLIMLILYFRFAPQNGIALILTPLAYGLKIPCIIPLTFGLTQNPVSAIAVICGTIVYYFMKFISEQAGVLPSESYSEIPKKLQMILDSMMKNQDMMIGMIAGVAVLLIVYMVRRTSMHYAWRVGIIIGAVSYLILMISGGLFFSMEIGLLQNIAGTVVAVILSFILEFFVFNMDYSRMEQYQYEDDEYYYYIKALPKVSITTAKRDIRTITEEELEEDIIIAPPLARNAKRKEAIEETPLSVSNQSIQEPVEEDVIKNSYEDVDFEKKLEESLRNL